MNALRPRVRPSKEKIMLKVRKFAAFAAAMVVLILFGGCGGGGGMPDVQSGSQEVMVSVSVVFEIR